MSRSRRLEARVRRGVRAPSTLNALANLAAPAAAALVAACGSSPSPADPGGGSLTSPPPPPVPAAGAPAPAASVASITEAEMWSKIAVLADDSMRGRDTPSPELEQTARYVASVFRAAGLRSASGSDYFQSWPFVVFAPWFPDSLARGLNVIGWIPGSDPVLRNEYVFFVAHMDHLGLGTPVGGDSVFNGADDNASGTAAVLELAEAFALASPAPRRSVVFLTVSGEEKGLWGSRYYTEHPLFPHDRTVAAINIDMIGRNWTDRVVAVGKDMSFLGPLAETVAADHPELGMQVLDDPWPNEKLFFRSDQFNFARFGVPILFFTSGLHPDYHQLSDEIGTLDTEKAARIVRLLLHLGWSVANADL